MDYQVSDETLNDKIKSIARKSIAQVLGPVHDNLQKRLFLYMIIGCSVGELGIYPAYHFLTKKYIIGAANIEMQKDTTHSKRLDILYVSDNK
jgi:hypothetical protein